MSSIVEVRIPELGVDDKVDVVEVLVAPGDRVAADDGLITLESEKASMDIPSPQAGTVRELAVAVGAKVGEGDLVLTLEVAGAEAPSERAGAEAPSERAGPATVAPSESGRSGPAATEDGTEFDLVVLGAGPGGYTAAFRAADLGQKVALVERYPTLGGVCLNVGCIPSKALLHAARVLDEARAFRSHGIDFGEPAIDPAKLSAWKDSVVLRLTKGLSALAKKRRVEVVQGEGRFTSPTTLEVTTGDGSRQLAFKQAVIAAGSHTVELPGIPWDDPRIMGSTEALELAEIPKRLLVVGGGIIGLEMATVYGALGSELTIVELLDGLIPGCDRDLVKPLERRLKKAYGASIHLETRVAEIKAQKRALKVTFVGEEALEPTLFDRVLISVGRRPNSDRIGLEATGVEVDERGFILVDARQRTNVSNIFAIGDIVGPPMLAHKATHEGKVAAEVAAGKKSAFDARAIPSVAYTDPEIAWVGLTETEAAGQGIAYERSSFPWSASGRSLGIGRSDGLTKLLFDPATKRLLGAGIVGPGAGDLISEAALALEMNCDAADLALTVHPHPTLSETLAFAAEAFEGTLTDLYLPRR